MEPLVNGHPGGNETWEELADHSFDHDDVGSPLLLAAARGPLIINVENGVTVVKDCTGKPLPRHPQRGERGWDWP
jgi:hypothetical protein